MVNDLKIFLEEWRVSVFKKEVDFNVKIKAIIFLNDKKNRMSWKIDTAAQNSKMLRYGMDLNT